MMKRTWLCAVFCAVLAAGCATSDNAPNPEAKAALAPTGKLRVAFLAVPIYAAKDAASGRYRGVAVDLGDSLAAKLGVSVEPMPHTTVSSLIAGAKANAFDVVLMGINAERAAVIDFSAPYMEVEQGVLVRSGVQVGKLEDIDRAGLRIGVLEKAGADVALSRRIKNAELVRAPSVDQLFALLVAGKVDLVAGTSSRLMEEQAKLPGSRMLDGRVTVEPIGMGVPKGRNPAAAQYVERFVEEAKASGLVARSIRDSRLAGVAVAPPK